LEPFFLILTLNASYQPDYDFTNTPSSEFSKELSLDYVVKDIENYLSPVEAYDQTRQKVWESIDNEINLSECEFYSYNPDLASDPCGEDGCLWFFNFFFFNKKMKRILFFSCRCTSKDELDDYTEDIIMSNDQHTTSRTAINTMIGFMD